MKSDTPDEETTAAPGRGAVFVPDPRKTPGYRTARGIFQAVLRVWFRPVVTGRKNVPETGPVILAPVHRSFIDFGFAAFVTRRKLFFMAKDDLWSHRFLGKALLSVGAFPVHRESADREALRHAEEVLSRGQVLVLFPEGTRQEGPEISDILEGAAFLAGRAGATIVPIGIGGSAAAMPKGSKVPRPVRVRVIVGEPIPPPARTESGRVPRSRVHQTTETLRASIQQLYAEAEEASR